MYDIDRAFINEVSYPNLRSFENFDFFKHTTILKFGCQHSNSSDLLLNTYVVFFVSLDRISNECYT